MQKVCTALLLDRLGRLLAACTDGCCYVLNPETLHQDAKLILHPSQTGKAQVALPPLPLMPSLLKACHLLNVSQTVAQAAHPGGTQLTLYSKQMILLHLHLTLQQ